MSEGLKHKTIKGVGWSFVDNISSSGISFIVGLVLARILSPEEYGIMAMVAIFIAVSNSIVDSGFSNALIRKTDARNIDYNTTFYFNLVISVLLYLLLYTYAPFVSLFFSEPVLTPIIRVLGLILIVNSCAIIQRTILVKAVDFKTQTKVSLIASIISGVIGIVMALHHCGVWSLVGQQLSRQVLNSFFLWIYGKWRPLLEFSVISFKELFGFGSKLLLSGLIDTIYKNIYYLVIGRFYNAIQLGQYTRAEQFTTIFSSNLTSVIQRVSYPVLSSIQEDSERLRDAYRKIIKVTMLITFACMLGLAAVAEPLVQILIGAKWLFAVPYLQILCFAEMSYPLHAINLNVLQVKGRSDLILKLEILKKVIGLIPVVLGIFIGINYMLWGAVVLSLVCYFLNSYYSGRLIDYSAKEQIKDIFPCFTVSVLVASLMWGITFLKLNLFMTLTFQLMTGFFFAFFVYEKLQLDEYREVRQIILSIIRKKA